MKKILLHACCGPCAEYPLEEMLKENNKITVYYNNPNIHPPFEWQRRLDQLTVLCRKLDLPLISEGRSQPEKWLAWEANGEKDRCRMCYEIRLEAAAGKAAQMGFQYFTTTLLVSPYQNYDLLIETGNKMAARYGVEFLPYDFRPGFRKGQNMAKEDGLYRQKYCGCIISLENSDFREKILLEQAKAQQK